MAKKVTTMVIRVDLGCEKCRKKIKKVLCKIPQIQNQTYDEKSNTVTITVVCCSPEKVKDKICRKAGNIISCGIEIIVPPKPVIQQTPSKPPAQQTPSKPPAQQTQSKPPETKPEKPEPPQRRTCCRECYEGHPGWGPCYRDPCMPPPCYGWPVYDSWGGDGCRRIYVSRCSGYVIEENPNAACIIM